jgi:iron complex outermembrane receptor protein
MSQHLSDTRLDNIKVEIDQMKSLKAKPLAVFIAAISMSGTAHHVYAQAEDDAAQRPTITEEVVVKGFAQSVANSIDAKRQADTVIQAISAADLGGLPDVSIADALGRLPSITVTRSGGQAGTIQVRGMGEGFVFSTLNGREQVSPNGTRAMEFSQFPSELINSVAVYMSPKASLIEGGVAGTVELETANPLEMREDQRINVGIRGSYNDQASDIYGADGAGYRLSLAFQKKLFDDTLGLSLGYAKLAQPRAAAVFEHYNYEDADVNGNEDARLSNGFEMMQDGGDETRDGYMAAIQFEPNEHLTVQSDVFYSKFKSESFRRGFRIQPLSGASIANPVYWDDGRHVIGGEFALPQTSGTALDIQVANDDNSSTRDVLSVGLNTEWRQDNWEVSADISHSEASGYEATGLTRSHLYRQDPTAPSGWSREPNEQVAYRLAGLSIPNVALSADYTDLAALRMSTYERYPRINDDQVSAVRLDGMYEFDMPIISSVETGVRYSERNHKERRQVFVYGDGSGGMINTDYSLAVTAENAEIVEWQGDFDHFPTFLAVDGEAIIQQALQDNLVLMSPWSFNTVDDPVGEFNPDAYNVHDNLRSRSIEPAARWGEGRAWSMRERADIDEKISAAYVQANLAMNVGGIDITGNVGVRYIQTDQSNLAMVNVGGDESKGAVEICDEVGDCRSDLAYQRVGTEYSNTLPSLNLNFGLTEDDQVRFALARVLSRPPINRLATFAEGSVDTLDPRGPTYNYGSNTSPFLTPFIADQVDISYEHYMPDTNGAFVIAAYHREIKSFIQDVSIENFPFEEYGFEVPDTATVVDAGGLQTEMPVRNGTYSYATNNDEGGYIRGLEVTYTQTFNFLPEPLSGLGLSAGVSLTESEIAVENPLSDSNQTLPFPGLVEESGNLTLFYAYENFETRLSASYQGPFVGETRNIDLDPVIYAAETVIDYQASYSFNNGVDLVFSVSNLTNEPNRSYMLDEDLTRKLQWFGRTFYLGANYSF